MKLIDRYGLEPEITRPNVWFKFGDWSVLNCGELMKTYPYPKGSFNDWEALRDGDDIIRAKSWEELEKILKQGNNQ